MHGGGRAAGCGPIAFSSTTVEFLFPFRSADERQSLSLNGIISWSWIPNCPSDTYTAPQHIIAERFDHLDVLLWQRLEFHCGEGPATGQTCPSQNFSQLQPFKVESGFQ
jgi:hypothetical protein